MGRIAYVTSQFPELRETFLLDEVLGLERNGLELEIFSIFPCRDAVVHQRASRVAAPVHDDHPWGLSVLAGAARETLRYPAATFCTLSLVLTHLARRPLELAKALVLLPKTLMIAEELRRRGIRHLHANWATVSSTVGYLAARLAGATFSVALHGERIPPADRLLRRRLSEALAIFSCGRDIAETVTALYDPPAGIEVLYHGVDTTLFSPGAEPAAGDPLVLCVGHIHPEKGQDVLVEACALAKNACRLSLVGEGPLEPTCRALARRLGIEDRVAFSGYVEHAQLPAIYRAARVFVLSARSELHWAIPNVVAEAMACGLPVVTTPLPGLADLVEDGITALTIPEDTPEAAATAIDRLLEDDELHRRLASAARDRVEQVFDRERAVAALARRLGAAAAGDRP